MKTKLKQIIVIIFIIVAVIIIYLVYKASQKTIYNDSSVIGNTAGNLYNGGLFCENNGLIYFSNNNDNGSLYSMDLNFQNVKKIHDDKPYYLNVDDNYIYYARANYTQKKEDISIFQFYNYGLYRITKNGKNIKMLSNNITDTVALAGSYIFFQVYEKKVGLDLYRLKIDGKDLSYISTENIRPFSIKDRILYYAPDSGSSDHFIRTLDLDTELETILYDGNCYMPIASTDFIYYISLEDKYNICSIDYNGDNKEVIVDEFCSFFNISSDERFLFYQIDGGEHNRIAMIDLHTMTQTTIRDGNYKNIHVIGNYVFFRDFNETDTYVYSTVDETLNYFRAPVIK